MTHVKPIENPRHAVMRGHCKASKAITEFQAEKASGNSGENKMKLSCAQFSCKGKEEKGFIQGMASLSTKATFDQFETAEFVASTNSSYNKMREIKRELKPKVNFCSEKKQREYEDVYRVCYEGVGREFVRTAKSILAPAKLMVTT